MFTTGPSHACGQLRSGHCTERTQTRCGVNDTVMVVLAALGAAWWLLGRGADAELEYQQEIGDELQEPE